jgi:hypothetical protein
MKKLSKIGAALLVGATLALVGVGCNSTAAKPGSSGKTNKPSTVTPPAAQYNFDCGNLASTFEEPANGFCDEAAGFAGCLSKEQAFSGNGFVYDVYICSTDASTVRWCACASPTWCTDTGNGLACQ